MNNKNINMDLKWVGMIERNSKRKRVVGGCPSERGESAAKGGLSAE